MVLQDRSFKMSETARGLGISGERIFRILTRIMYEKTGCKIVDTRLKTIENTALRTT